MSEEIPGITCPFPDSEDVPASRAVGLKFDGGKLPMHLLAPEALMFLTAHRPECWAASVNMLACWFGRFSPRGLIHVDSGPRFSLPSPQCVGEYLPVAFEYMMHEINKALGGDEHDGCARAWEELARVLAAGARKYGERNWERGLHYSRCYAAALRHTFKFLRGETIDSEFDADGNQIGTLCHSLACAASEIMFLVAFESRPDLAREFDDRPGAGNTWEVSP